MRTIGDIIKSCDKASGGTVELEWADWQTLKSAVLAQQTTNKQIMPCSCVGSNAFEVTIFHCNKCGKTWLP
jgi:hypothetical protein